MEEFFDVDNQNHVAAADPHSNVDTSRPFRSVKEAVAVFGERFLAGEIYSPKRPFSFPHKETPNFSPASTTSMHRDRTCHWSRYSSPGTPLHDTAALSETVKKLEVDLEETKAELRLLKEKESDTEVALAAMNAELMRKNSIVSYKPAQADPEAAMGRSAGSRSLSQILMSTGHEKEDRISVGKKREKKSMKKKPIIPLIGSLIWRQKGSSSSSVNQHPLYSHLHWN